MKKRLLCILLTIALALLPVQALAAPVSCQLVDKGITFTWQYYIVYRYHGEDYNSNETDPQTNYEAWTHMSAEDKMKVLRHFSGFNGQLRSQFANVNELLDYGLEKTGWARLRDTFNQKMAAKYFPALDTFYGENRRFELPYDAETYLSAGEVRNYQQLLKEYYLIRSSGKEAYDRLVKLKKTQISNAVNAISSELIQIIMDNATMGKPSGELDDLLDSAVETLDENLKISESLKEITGLKTPEDAVREFVEKYTGEEDRIDTDKAIKLIDLIDRLMTMQEKHATVCMDKCKLREKQLTDLGATYTAAATQRKADKEAAEAKRQDAYREAVKQNVNLVDLTPGISVNRNNYDSNHDGTLDADEQEKYHAACLSAAKSWSADQWKWATDNLREFWQNNYANEVLKPGDARYFDAKRFTQWQTKYDDGMRVLPNEFYNNAFSAVRSRLGEDAPVFTGTPGSYGGWEELFASRTDYREALLDYEHGYDAALAALNDLKVELQTARENYLSAWETARNQYVTTVSPWRTLAYNLTHQIQGEWYGDWRFPAEEAEQKWLEFERANEQFGQYFLRGAEQIDPLVTAIDAEIARVTTNRELFVQGRDAYYNSLPGYFKQCTEVQEELEDGLAIANYCLSELAKMKENYPDWVTQFNVSYPNPIVGGMVIPEAIMNQILGDSRYFTGTESYDEQVAKLENTLAPMLGDWLRREKELLNQLQRAEKLLKEVKAKRTKDYTGWHEAELSNLNSLPGVNHGVTIVPMRNLIMSSDPYYHHYNVLNYYDEYDVREMPSVGYTPQLTALYNDMIGNGAPMRQIRARYARLLEERGDLLRVAKEGKLREMNDFYSEMGYEYNYFFQNYGTVSWNDSSNIYYWAWHGSLRPWDLYYYHEATIKPVANAIDAVDRGGAYNPVKRLEKVGAGAAALAEATTDAVLAEAAPDAVLETGGTMRFSVMAVGEDASVEPSYPNVFWSSSDESIASVDTEGTITGRLPGTVTITATAEDSPRSNPITVNFTLQVRSGSFTEISQLGGGIYMLSPRAVRSGAQVCVSGVLGINGDEFVSGTLIAAAYANGRFLGCTASPFRIQGSETTPLDCALPLASANPADVTVKLFLVESAGFRPQTGYSPVLLTLSDG